MTNLINEDMLNQTGEESCCCGGGSKNDEGCCREEEASVGCNCMNEDDSHDHEHDHHDHAHGHHHHDHDHEGHDHAGHDHEHEHNQVVTFENEDGTTSEYPVVDEFEFDGSLYVLVLNADDTVTPLRSVGEEGELQFLTEEEFDEVSKAYNEILDAEDEEETEEDTEV